MNKVPWKTMSKNLGNQKKKKSKLKVGYHLIPIILANTKQTFIFARDLNKMFALAYHVKNVKHYIIFVKQFDNIY